MDKVVHLITVEEIESLTLQLERNYVGEYGGQQLRDRVAACTDLKRCLLEAINVK